MEWLQNIYDNAMANMERHTGAYSDSANQWGFLVAILAAVVVGIAINRYLKSRRGGGRDGNDRGR
ncbi:MAG TPA: hypothetical protein VKN76_06070 [Kiloniellaceae bacterium]|nr:hypothetical protein [Kiloniellaceae bacterium]